MTNHLANIDRSQNQAISEDRLKVKVDTLTPKQQHLINEVIPSSQRRLFADAYEGKSNVKAIKAKCLDCCHSSKEDVALCKVEICPLWKIRPYQTKTDLDID